jgi:hypothetical protein
MRLVTYDAGSGPRVGALEGDEVHDLGFDGEMVAFIAAGFPAALACSPRCGRGRCATSSPSRDT